MSTLHRNTGSSMEDKGELWNKVWTWNPDSQTDSCSLLDSAKSCSLMQRSFSSRSGTAGLSHSCRVKSRRICKLTSVSALQALCNCCASRGSSHVVIVKVKQKPVDWCFIGGTKWKRVTAIKSNCTWLYAGSGSSFLRLMCENFFQLNSQIFSCSGILCKDFKVEFESWVCAGGNLYRVLISNDDAGVYTLMSALS